MALRIKGKWHRSRRSPRNIQGSARPKTLSDLSSVISFNIWKVSKELYQNMAKDKFKFIDESMVMGIITETIAFLSQVVDRTIYDRIDENERGPFMNAMAKHLGETMQTNMSEMWGEADYVGPFYATLNQRFAEYAECSFSEEEGGYAFRRLLGEHIADLMSSGDNRWVVEHVMDIEAPKAMALIQKLTVDILGLRQSKQAPGSAELPK